MILQSHYTATGKATTDRTRIAVKFASKRPETEVRFGSLINGGLHIPAGAADQRGRRDDRPEHHDNTPRTTRGIRWN